MKKFLIATIGALALALPVHAQDGVVGGIGEDYSPYDTNNDRALDDSEFTTVLEGDDTRFQAYDRDGDGIITEDEFAAGEFGRYDRDQDALIDADEWASFWQDETYYQDSPLEERGVERAGSERGEDIIDANQPEQDVIE